MDRKEFESWLREQDQETCVKIATRAALRVFPVAAYNDDSFALTFARSLLGLVLMVETPAPKLAEILDSIDASLTLIGAEKAANESVVLFNINSSAIGKLKSPFRAARSTNALLALLSATTQSFRDKVPRICARNLINSRVLGPSEYGDFGVSSQKLFQTPLWHANRQPDFNLPGENLLETPAFAFWKEWYQGFLDGSPMDWDLQCEVALIPDEDWKKGAEHIARLIEEIRARFDLRKRIAELEAELSKVATDRLGIGGNNPPEEIEPVLPVAKELLVIWEPLQELKHELEAEEPDKGRIAQAIEALGAALKAGLKWAAGKADLAVDTTIITTIKWGIPAVGGSYLALNPDKITQVIEAAKHWLSTLP